MGLSDRCAGALPRADALCRAIVCECARRHFRGVLADFEPGSPSDRLAFLTRLTGALSARGIRLYCPAALPTDGATLLIGTAVSGGSLQSLLERSINHFASERLALDLERVQMDFPLPCPTGCGTPLRHEELLALQQSTMPQSIIPVSLRQITLPIPLSAARTSCSSMMPKRYGARSALRKAMASGRPSSCIPRSAIFSHRRKRKKKTCHGCDRSFFIGS